MSISNYKEETYITPNLQMRQKHKTIFKKEMDKIFWKEMKACCLKTLGNKGGIQDASQNSREKKTAVTCICWFRTFMLLGQ